MPRVVPHLDDGAWFHGSPLELEMLAAGSTITRCRAVAEAFSHKPTCLGIDDAAGLVTLCHNGREPGLLYRIAEELAESDVTPHPWSSFTGGGLEWLTTRPLRLRRVGSLPIGEPPCLGETCPRRRSKD